MSDPYALVCTANDASGNLWEQFNVNVKGEGRSVGARAILDAR